MSFTELLYEETKNLHNVVDRHPFVGLIRKNKMAGEMYINFNKLCINEIQKTIVLNDDVLYGKLSKDIMMPDVYISNVLSKILEHCKEYPLESGYQFYLGLLFGGNILKKMLPEYEEFLTYDNPKELIVEFKNYLCNNVNEKDYDRFINNVKKLYILINELFDEFYDFYDNI